ncbi:glycosyltransferase family 2 protein [Daejeonia sp. YH14]|uniref:glycosyltransferase family 2 protein n=1 Tax=Daejeonia sp. YH14 TaxID=3439042 RepID=UPI003F498CA7
MKTPNIYAVIVTYNGMKNNWIIKCLDSLFQSELAVEIIVVDNGSQDNSVKYINENYKNILLIESKTNLGFGKANNVGIKKAIDKGAEYVFLLNQDAYIQPDTIRNLYEAFEKETRYGIISPMQMSGRGDAIDFNFSNYISPRHCKGLYSDFVVNSVKNKIYESKFINAAAWLISRKCLEEVGGFNPTFYHYGEDVNYIHRLHYKNFKIGVLPTSFIYHDREDRIQESTNSLDYLNRKNALKINTLFSDPNNKGSEFIFLCILSLKFLFNLSTFKIFKTKAILFQIKHLLSNNKAIKKNLILSKSNKKFVFIENS